MKWPSSASHWLSPETKCEMEPDNCSLFT